MKNLLKEKKYGLAKKLSNISRYIDDIAVVDYQWFERWLSIIYPESLIANRSGESNTCVNYLDINISINEKNIVTDVYHKVEDFNFEVALYTNVKSNIPYNLGLNIFASQALRFGRICSNGNNFLNRVNRLLYVMIKQGYDKDKLLSKLRSMLSKNTNILSKFGYISGLEICVKLNDHSRNYSSDNGLAYDFTGFTKTEIHKTKSVNEKRMRHIKSTNNLNTDKNNFTGFAGTEISEAKTINTERISNLLNNLNTIKVKTPVENFKKSLPSRYSINKNRNTILGIMNLGNTCYMNSVMQCLNSLKYLVTYFERNDHLRDIYPESKYKGILVKEISAAFNNMNSHNSPISLVSLKNLIGNLYPPFIGFEQEDAHEFLIKLLELMYEDLGIINMSTLQDTTNDKPNEQKDKVVPKIMEILQGIHKITILCKSCHYTSSSFEPFNILSLFPSTTKNSKVEELIKYAYKDNCIDYTCPICGKQDSVLQKYEIVKLPKILILHLKRFDVNSNGISKNQQYVDFPLEKLKIGENELFFNLKGITNHYGTLNAGHYIGFCKSRNDEEWYKCDDSIITKISTSLKNLKCLFVVLRALLQLIIFPG